MFIFFYWIAEALLSENFSLSRSTISISRTTTSCHGVMALILIVGYLVLIIENIYFKKNTNMLYILLIGITVQLGWETALFVIGIRQSGIETLVINSLIEKNLDFHTSIISTLLLISVLEKRREWNNQN